MRTNALPFSIVAALAATALLSGCPSERPKFRGEGCELNTECEDPLVCGFNRCRIECRTEVDCAAGLKCLLDTRSGLGYCQLDDELECTLDSECEAACRADPECEDRLACRDGECGQECSEPRDCPEGSTCEESGGSHTCEPASRAPCVYNSDCPPGQVCNERQQCWWECSETRDCDFPRVCDMTARLCVLPDGGA